MARFVIHEHHARNLHWDLRLEMHGALRSWAVPKVPPQKKGEKRLAIQVEDHRLEYIDFEGHLSEGYGAGDVYIWDRGELEVREEEKEKIVFELSGKKMRGTFVLVIPKWGGGKTQWLLMRTAGPEPKKIFGPAHAPKTKGQAARVSGKGKAPVQTELLLTGAAAPASKPAKKTAKKTSKKKAKK